MSAVMLYVTARDREEAARIAAALVEERLIACGNVIDGMESVYWWNGKVERSREAVLIAKTDRRNVDLVTARIIELHSYETPCVVALPIEGGNPLYLNWIEHESTAWDTGLAG
ncbi:MAG TPA: divalent-cation tolerance protein CutA [Planctomycetaceae bacterium]